MHENEIARIVVDSAYKIHSTLGPGLLESVYEALLMYELENAVLKWFINRRFRLYTTRFASKLDLELIWW